MERVILPPREGIFPEIHTLNSEILGAYTEGMNSYEGRDFDSLSTFDSLYIFQDRKGELVGNNCFAPLKLREFLPEGTRLATMADLGRATEIDPYFLRKFCSDTGLVLRTAGDSYKVNDFLAKDLAEQLKRREITVDNPKIIYFDALDLREDLNSHYGLAYNLSERTVLGVNIIDAPELRSYLGFKTRNDMTFKTMNEKGIPIADENGDRNLFSRPDGLSRFYLNGASNINSHSYSLVGSLNHGRIVVVSDKGIKLEE